MYQAFCLPSLGCRGCSSSQYPWGCEELKGVLPFSQEVLPGGLGSCDPRYWGELAKAWGSEVKRHILQIPDRVEAAEGAPFPIPALTWDWSIGTAEVEEELV